MKNKRLILILILLAIVGVCVIVFFISRLPQQELLPQTFAQLPEKPKLIDEFHQNTRIYSVAFSPSDPSLIALADENGTIKLWYRNITNKPAPILNHPGKYTSISFSPTGELLASAGSGKLILWDVTSKTKLNSIEPSSRNFAFSPDGHQLATVHNEVKLWDIRNPKKIAEITNLPFNEAHKARGWVSTVGISSDGKWIAVGYSHGTINVWDFKTKQFVKTLETSYYDMNFFKFSPDNKFLAAGGPMIYMDDNKKEWTISTSRGYRMWELPSWKRHGEVQRGNIDNLVFSPNGKVCVCANDQSFSGRGVELWAVESGVPVTFLPTQARDVSFSQDGSMLVSGNDDGVVQVWELTPEQLEAATPPTDLVRIIYYLLKDKEPSPNITERIDKSIREAQDFYADEMERHGFGRKTFSFETDENGKAKVYLGKGVQINEFDQSNGIWLTIEESQFRMTYPYSFYADHNDTFWYISDDGYLTRNNVWRHAIKGIIPVRNVHTSVKSLGRESVAYALKGAFSVPYIYSVYKRNSLKRLFSRINDKMPWGKKWAKLSKCEAEWLDRSRFFNPNQPFFDKSPKIDMNVSPMNASNSRRFHFEIADEDGIHQVQLFVPIDIKNQRWQKKFYDCKALNGKEKATVIFEISDPEIETVVLRMMDMHGNIASREFIIKEKTDEK